MALNSVVTIEANTGWSKLALPKGPLSLNNSIPSRIATRDLMISSLTASNPTTYTMPRLLNMTTNDMLFAFRNIFDPGNI